MTPAPDDRLMPAQNPDESTPTDTTGEEVKNMALFESRKRGTARAWDELSEIDRAVLLESVRQRRNAEQQKQKIYSQVYGIRSNR